MTAGFSLQQENGEQGPYCWRNLFSCINLLRLLNKLTKWKHSRTMVRSTLWQFYILEVVHVNKQAVDHLALIIILPLFWPPQMLVVFKSAPILKRALKVRHAMLQLYVLKLLKSQTRYFGRQWRKSNMKTLSAIYQKVRHRLTDDWAYGNGRCCVLETYQNAAWFESRKRNEFFNYEKVKKIKQHFLWSILTYSVRKSLSLRFQTWTPVRGTFKRRSVRCGQAWIDSTRVDTPARYSTWSTSLWTIATLASWDRTSSWAMNLSRSMADGWRRKCSPCRSTGIKSWVTEFCK